MIDRKLCSCGRPRAGAADLKRWRDEAITHLLMAVAAAFNPVWAQELCWTKPGRPCVMRPPPS